MKYETFKCPCVSLYMTDGKFDLWQIENQTRHSLEKTYEQGIELRRAFLEHDFTKMVEMNTSNITLK